MISNKLASFFLLCSTAFAVSNRLILLHLQSLEISSLNSDSVGFVIAQAGIPVNAHALGGRLDVDTFSACANNQSFLPAPSPAVQTDCLTGLGLLIQSALMLRSVSPARLNFPMRTTPEFRSGSNATGKSTFAPHLFRVCNIH